MYAVDNRVVAMVAEGRRFMGTCLGLQCYQYSITQSLELAWMAAGSSRSANGPCIDESAVAWPARTTGRTHAPLRLSSYSP